MQREIRFRGLRTDGKGWVNGYYLRAIDDKTNDVRCIIFPYESMIVESPIEVIPSTVGQFTGLKDKNENDIYEGDIIDIYQTVNGVSAFVILSCIGGYDVRYYYENKPQREYEYSIYELLDIGKTEKELEIIGNIHEQKTK